MDGETTRTAAELSREELYALVWERPLNRIGPELGLDGARLAKLCDKRLVPYPPPGYWQKKAVGRSPTPTPLPPQDLAAARAKGPRSSGRVPLPPVKEVRAILTEQRAQPSVSAPKQAEAEVQKEDGLDALDRLHPKIRSWIADHKREQREQAQENRSRKKDVWSWSKSMLDDLTSRDLYRIRASSTLCHSIEKASGKVKDADIHGKLSFTIQGRDIECTVKEKMSRSVKRLDGDAGRWTAYPQHHNAGLESSGWLRAQITTWLPGEQPQWVETPTKSISALIPAIVETVVACVPRLIEWEKQREEERRRYQEEERRRWELRRLQEIDDRRWDRFRSAATNWREKQLLDALIVELEARLACEGDQILSERTTTEWLSWARDHTLDLDPLADGILGLFREVLKP